MRHKEQFIAKQEAKIALANFCGDNLLDRVLDGFEASQRMDIFDDGHRVRDDGRCGVQ